MPVVRVVRLVRNKDGKNSDKPTSKAIIRWELSSKQSSISVLPSVENEEPAAEPEEDTSSSGPSTFFDNPVSGKFVLLLDASGSMSARDASLPESVGGNVLCSPSRLDVVKAEAIKVIKRLTESDEMDIISFSGTPRNPIGDTRPWQGTLTPCNEANKTSAIEFINDLRPFGGTPSYKVLQQGCTNYGSELDKLIFLTDGAPDPRYQVQAILNEFPEWFKPLRTNGCELVAIQIGNNMAAGNFMQQFAELTGATFTRR